MAKNENPLQGSFIIEELTDLVEEAILTEFDRITERGGVLGAMETMYQRGKIQEESLYYETIEAYRRISYCGCKYFPFVKRLSNYYSEGSYSLYQRRKRIPDTHAE